MSTNTTPTEVATRYVTAFGSGDLSTVAGYLADDVVFESPRVTLVGAPAVREAIGQFARAVIGVNIIAVLGDDEKAMVMYDMTTGPFGTLRVVDYLTVRDGKITTEVLVFDTYEIRKAEEAQAASS